VAEPPSETTVTTTTTTTPLTSDQAVVAFQECLATQGMIVADLPLDEHGRPDLSVLADAIDPNSVAWKDALTVCSAVITANGGLGLQEDLELSEAVMSQLTAFSACMRSEDVEDFPDPPADFDGTSPPFPISAIPVGDPDLGPAADTCAGAVENRPPA
jgi:hypothetical protein